MTPSRSKRQAVMWEGRPRSFGSLTMSIKRGAARGNYPKLPAVPGFDGLNYPELPALAGSSYAFPLYDSGCAGERALEPGRPGHGLVRRGGDVHRRRALRGEDREDLAGRRFGVFGAKWVYRPGGIRVFGAKSTDPEPLARFPLYEQGDIDPLVYRCLDRRCDLVRRLHDDRAKDSDRHGVLRHRQYACFRCGLAARGHLLFGDARGLDRC